MSGGALGGLVVAALFSTACWLAIALLVFVTLVDDTGWLVPLLVAAGLLLGFVIGLGPAYFYRGESKALERALEATAAEVTDQVLLDPLARDSRPLTEGTATSELSGSDGLIVSWWADEQG